MITTMTKRCTAVRMWMLLCRRDRPKETWQKVADRVTNRLQLDMANGEE